jgi:hypothetical protein
MTPQARIASPRSAMLHVFVYDPCCHHNPRMIKNSDSKRDDSSSSTEDMRSESLAELRRDGSVCASQLQSLAEVSLDETFCSVDPMDNNRDAPPKQSNVGLKRRVRFRVDKANCILSDESSAGSIRISGEEREAMWWNREEMKEIQHHARFMCKLYLENKSEFCRDIALFLTQCARTDTSEYCVRTNQTVNSVDYGPTRGIESYLVPMFQRRQKQSVRAVVGAQGAGQHAPDDAAHLLSIRYQHWSRYAVTWARFIADADAMCHLHDH